MARTYSAAPSRDPPFASPLAYHVHSPATEQALHAAPAAASFRSVHAALPSSGVIGQPLPLQQQSPPQAAAAGAPPDPPPPSSDGGSGGGGGGDGRMALPPTLYRSFAASSASPALRAATSAALLVPRINLTPPLLPRAIAATPPTVLSIIATAATTGVEDGTGDRESPFLHRSALDAAPATPTNRAAAAAGTGAAPPLRLG